MSPLDIWPLALDGHPAPPGDEHVIRKLDRPFR